MIEDFITMLLVNTGVFSVLFACMILLRKLLSKRISAVLQYVLWAVVVIKLVIPFGFESAISPLQLFSSPVQTQAAEAGAITTAADIQYTADKNNPSQNSIYQQSNNSVPQNNTKYTLEENAVQEQKNIQPLHWTVWAFILWGVGAAATGSWLLLCLLQVRRRIFRKAVKAPARFIEVFEECKAGLGIRRSIGIRMQGFISAPAITGVLKPMLLLPAGSLDMDEQQLRFICLHELMHYKNGDLIVIKVMNILNCLYWFNPPVWLCFKLMKKDMETVCDQSVLRFLDKDMQNGYVKTLLHFAGKPEKKPYARRLEHGRRPQGYGKTHPRYVQKEENRVSGMKILAAAIALMMLAVCTVTACRPTPEKPVVMNKASGSLEEKVKNSSGQEQQYEAPLKWEDSFTRGKLEVNVNASPGIPDVKAFPVVKMKYAPFTQADVDLFAKILMQGQKLYLTNHPPTKAELEKELIEEKDTLQRKIKDPESHGDSVEDMQMRIKDLEGRIQQAPETASKEYVDPSYFTFTAQIKSDSPAPGGNYGHIEVSADLPGYETSATLQVNNTPENSVMQFQNGALYQPLHDETVTQAKNLKTTMKEAVGKAKALVTSMEAEGMEIAKAVVGSALPYKDQTWDYKDSLEHQGYIVCFRRAYAGISTTYDPEDGAEQAQTNGSDYNKRPQIESLTVHIDDTGVTGVKWAGRMAVDSVVSQNSKLMPFKEMAKAFEQNIFVSYAWAEGDEKTLKYTIDIDIVALGYFCSAVKDKPDEYLLIPVWDFNGARTTKSNIEKIVSEFDEKDREAARKQAESEDGKAYRSAYSMLTLSAIDGSIVNRARGY